MSVKRYEWVACDEHSCHCDVVESVEGDMVDYEDYAALEARCLKLAAENAGLKSIQEWAVSGVFKSGAKVFESTKASGFDTDDCLHDAVLVMLSELKTPETDAFLAEVRAQARNEGINYAASRLAAAFNHGFVDKPLSEVYDVVRMILDTKEELANSTLPAADGLSGEYAEEFLEEFAAQIRKGVQS